MATLHYIGERHEVPPGGRKFVQIGKKSIGVFNIGGEFYALLNLCPHQFAPLCEGRLTGYSPPSAVGEYRYEREGEIIRCPWHGWEFDVKTGRSIFNPREVRTATYSVRSGVECLKTGAVEGVEMFPVVQKESALYLELK